MMVSFHRLGRDYEFDSDRGVDLSYHLFKDHVCAFSSKPPKRHPFKTPEFIGSLEDGGPCQCDVITFVPHTHGTHTESMAHIIAGQPFPIDLSIPSLMLARLMSYEGGPEISSSNVSNFFNDPCQAQALILRRRDRKNKKPQDAKESIPSYVSPEMMTCMVQNGIEHFFFDSPSVDPIVDGGALLAHRAFWSVENGKNFSRNHCTITELIQVPETLQDGYCLINLQLAPMALDATPSRPIVFPIMVKESHV